MKRFPGLLAFVFFIGFLLLIDWYVFTGLRTLTLGLETRTRKIVHWLYWGINFSLFLWLITISLLVRFGGYDPKSFSVFLGVWALLFVPKLLFGVFLLGEDIYRLLRSLFAMGHNAIIKNEPMPLSTSRRKFISTLAAATAAVPFVGIIHGMAVGKFKYQVRRETIYFPDLPEAFDGFTITQLSDIHAGSFDTVGHRLEVQRALTMANDQHSDLLVFTGDLVNNRALEMDPWLEDFKKLHAPYGKFSVLGNHDYGDYVSWESEKEKAANLDDLFLVHEQIGFKLLRDQHTIIEKDGQTISVLGVENWGASGFKQVGDLDKALQDVPKDAFKILLSHDPSHFDNIVSKHNTHIHLTFSGHTHGGQFGIEIPGIKWSPIQMRYPHWAGLYTVNGRNIYVNRGFGFLALPARVGIWPEIAVLTLKKGVPVS